MSPLAMQETNMMYNHAVGGPAVGELPDCVLDAVVAPPTPTLLPAELVLTVVWPLNVGELPCPAVLSVAEARLAVTELPSKVTIACAEPDAVPGPVLDSETVCVPPITSPPVAALTIVPAIVAAGPPGVKDVPATTSTGV